MGRAPGTTIDHYDVTALIGQAGMGEDRRFTPVAGSPR
jgi:hypothetical protein